MTGIEGARVVTNAVGGYVQTVVYRQNAGRINDNGIDGIGLIFKVGSGPARVASQDGGETGSWTTHAAGIALTTASADGPLPIGDAIGGVIIAGAVVRDATQIKFVT